jgi:hypothetical protein
VHGWWCYACFLSRDNIYIYIYIYVVAVERVNFLESWLDIFRCNLQVVLFKNTLDEIVRVSFFIKVFFLSLVSTVFDFDSIFLQSE